MSVIANPRAFKVVREEAMPQAGVWWALGASAPCIQGGHHVDCWEDIMGNFLGSCAWILQLHARFPLIYLSCFSGMELVNWLLQTSVVPQIFFHRFSLFNSNSATFITLPPRQLTAKIKMLYKFFQNDAFAGSLRLCDLQLLHLECPELWAKVYMPPSSSYAKSTTCRFLPMWVVKFLFFMLWDCLLFSQNVFPVSVSLICVIPPINTNGSQAPFFFFWLEMSPGTNQAL